MKKTDVDAGSGTILTITGGADDVRYIANAAKNFGVSVSGATAALIALSNVFHETVKFTKMMADIDKWQDAPLWDAESIAVATKTWFPYMTPKVS